MIYPGVSGLVIRIPQPALQDFVMGDLKKNRDRTPERSDGPDNWSNHS